MTRTLVLLTLLDALPALADNLDQGIVHKASQQQAGHYAKPGPGRSHPAPRVVNVYSTRPGYYSGDDRYSGNRAVYAAYSNAGYGPSGGRRGGYGGGFGGAYNIEMQRLLTHQYELRSIALYLPTNPVAPAVMHNPNFVPRANQLETDDRPAPEPMTLTNPFVHPQLAQETEQP